MKKMGRRILWILILIILFLFSFAVVYPLIFLLGGSLKSTPELGNNLAALWSADGTLHWTWLPFEPTLQHYVELLFDEPGYYVMFWNSVKTVGGVIGGQLLLSLYLSTITKENAGVAFVAALIALLPPLLVFLCGRKYLEQGIAAIGGSE